MATHRKSSSRVCFPQIKKSIIVTLLFWNVIVSCLLSTGEFQITTISIRSPKANIVAVLLFCCLFGVLYITFPFSGLIADICCGRYKIITSSAIIIWFISIFLAVSAILREFGHKKIALVLGVVSVPLSMLSLSGFMSNSVQFSLDQFLDAPSEEVSLFLHWFVWTEYAGKIIAPLLTSFSLFCNNAEIKWESFAAIAGLATITAGILIISKQTLFYQEKVSKSPYWNVLKVLRYVAKHRKPLKHRSAFTYSGDENPLRIDFAKRKYGGPFETDVVEDVKTFLKIVVMLFSTSLIFYLLIPNFYLFPYFGLHLGKNVSLHHTCTYEWMLFQSGNFSVIISILFVPLYLQILHPYIKNWLLIATRLGIGIFLMVASTISMLIIQTLATKNALERTSNYTTCFLLANYNYHFVDQTLDYFPQLLAVTNFLNGIAAPLIHISVLEFISAQSPHTMKGLILGVFYAFKGLFITLGSVATFPFAQESLWRDQHGMFDCGFYYHLSNSVFGVFGLVVFILAARWYRYRSRGDPPYSYQYAENYFTKSVLARPLRKLNSFEDYGTM